MSSSLILTVEMFLIKRAIYDILTHCGYFEKNKQSSNIINIMSSSLILTVEMFLFKRAIYDILTHCGYFEEFWFCF